MEHLQLNLPSFQHVSTAHVPFQLRDHWARRVSSLDEQMRRERLMNDSTPGIPAISGAEWWTVAAKPRLMISWGGIVKSLTQSIVWREYVQYFHYYNLVGMVTNQIEWGIINQSIVGNPFHLTESRDDRGSWKLFRSLLIVIVRKLSHLKLGCTIAVSGTHIFTHIFPMFKVSEDSYPWKHQWFPYSNDWMTRGMWVSSWSSWREVRLWNLQTGIWVQFKGLDVFYRWLVLQPILESSWIYKI